MSEPSERSPWSALKIVGHTNGKHIAYDADCPACYLARNDAPESHDDRTPGGSES